MSYAIDVDPADVLGVSQTASLGEIHEAYRTRVKKHHPDVGGDEWAFRLVTRAYEFLSNARVQARLFQSNTPPPSNEPEFGFREYQQPPEPKHAPPPPPDNESVWVRAGVEDHVEAPISVVDVELFTIRYELESPLDILKSAKNRNLSSCMNVSWPSHSPNGDDQEMAPDPDTLKILKKVFDALPKPTKAISSWSQVQDGRFVGWASYNSATQAHEAFEVFHRALQDKGLGARQVSRELYISRDSR
jgi:curved DNA-binding protein CbpA